MHIYAHILVALHWTLLCEFNAPTLNGLFEVFPSTTAYNKGVLSYSVAYHRLPGGSFLRLIGVAILLGFAGTLAAALWTFVIGIAGAPGALLTAFGEKKKSPVVLVGLMVTIISQSYVAIAFVAFVVQ